MVWQVNIPKITFGVLPLPPLSSSTCSLFYRCPALVLGLAADADAKRSNLGRKVVRSSIMPPSGIYWENLKRSTSRSEAPWFYKARKFLDPRSGGLDNIFRSSHTPPQSLNGSSVIISNISRFEHVSPIVWFQMDCELPSPFNVSELNVWKTTRQLLVGSGEEDIYNSNLIIISRNLQQCIMAFFRFHTNMEQCGKENFLQPFEFPPDWAVKQGKHH